MTMQSPDRSLIDTLIRSTVHCVLFGDDDCVVDSGLTSGTLPTTLVSEETLALEQTTNDESSRTTSSSPESPLQTDIKTPELTDTTDAQSRRLLRQLFIDNAAGCRDEDEASRERGPEEVEVALISQQQVLQCCCQWPCETLASVKAALKAFLRSISVHTGHGGVAPRELPAIDAARNSEPRPDRRYAQVYETYALVKLFLLEKDERYRALKLAEPGIGGSRTVRRGIAMEAADIRRSATAQHRFLVLLRVQLALYAHYFELAYGRKVRARPWSQQMPR
jgi:hypothetical protein